MIPVSIWLLLVLAALVISSSLRFTLSRLNTGNLKKHGKEIPPEFQGEIDQETLSRITDYTLESSRFGNIESLFDDALLIAVILLGFIPWLAAEFDSRFGFVTAGLAFFGSLFLLSWVIGLPFSLYSTFVIEKKYGFSTITFRMWLADLLKGAAISIVLMGALLAIFLWLLDSTPLWWFWAWLVFSGFQLLMLWLYPVLIAPLFNRFEPVADEELKQGIIEMMERRGLKVQGIFQIDAGKRSRHTNAYFTGIGKTKRIVLYDTLLQSHPRGEILAVLAHELGHWTRKHVLKQFALMEIVSLLVLSVSACLIRSEQFYSIFGFTQTVAFAGLFFVGVVLKPLSLFFTPIGAAMSRRFERQADSDACSLTGNPADLADAFKRLAKDNLANLHPHPLFAWFYYSHPPLVERIRNLNADCKKAP
ncbi:MAG: M48 family metallopeptidase [Syntrophaceae bacterium]